MLTTVIKSVFLFIAGPVISVHANEVITYSGKAYSMDDSRTLLYCEEHQLKLLNDEPYKRQVRYFDSNNNLIAEKENNYFSNPAAPEFSFHDKRHNYYEQARYNDDGSLTLILKEDNDSQSQKIQAGDLPDNLIIDAGFDEFVRRHWQSLLSGQTVSFSFASVARLDLISFRLKKIADDDQKLVLSMRLESRLLAWLLDPIELTYDRNNRNLLRYRGLSNIMDTNGETYSADIRYDYSSGCQSSPSSATGSS